MNNFTHQKRTKVKNILKKDSTKKISKTKISKNNIQNIIELLNTKNKKYPININTNSKKSRNYDVNDIAYNTGTINPNLLTSDGQLNECCKTFLIKNDNKKNGIIKTAININNKKNNIIKTKLYKLNKSLGFPNEIVKNRKGK